MNARDKIIRCIEAYCERTGLSPATVGHKVANSSSFYQRLKEGANMRMDTYEKARDWFAAEGIDLEGFGSDSLPLCAESGQTGRALSCAHGCGASQVEGASSDTTSAFTKVDLSAATNTAQS